MISVVIPNYNGKRFLTDCIDSLITQTCKDFEIIVVDNGSTDGSVPFLKDYPDISVIALDKNYGFSKAVNAGIRASSGEYVVLLNNDTKAMPDFLSALLDTIEKDKTIFSCSSCMLRFDNPGLVDDAGDFLNLFGWAYKNGDGKPKSGYEKSYEIFSSCAGAAIYRKSVFDEIGYFDEAFFAYLEDVDLSYRAKKAGYRNVFAPGAFVLHIGSATTGSKYNDFKVRLSARNTVFLIYKNMPYLFILVNLPFLLAGFLIKLLFFWVKGFFSSYLSGFREGLSSCTALDRSKSKSWSADFKIELELIFNLFRYIFHKIL